MRAKNLEEIERRLTKVRVIYTDIDGTLVGPGGSLFKGPDGTLTLKPARAVLKVLEAGVDVFIVSGRTKERLKAIARIFGFRNYAAELGSEIIYDLGGKVIHNIEGMDLEKGERPLDWIKNSGALDLIFEEFPGKIRYHIPFSEACQNSALLIGNIEVKRANQILTEHGLAALRLADNGPAGPAPDFPHPHCYHLLSASIGKRSAVEKDKEVRALRTEELVGIGESIEDIEISSEVGVYFVVRNGAEEDPRVMRAAKQQRNVFLLDYGMGLGWAEAIDILGRLGRISCCTGMRNHQFRFG